MSISTLASNPRAVRVEITDEILSISLDDGRVVSVPISWYPRLSNALPEHRTVWEFIGRGHGIHWPELDEDISVENVLLGQPSGEGAQSFARWKQWYQQKIAEPGGPANRSQPVGPETNRTSSAAGSGG
jgi:hypothetical protein